MTYSRKICLLLSVLPLALTGCGGGSDSPQTPTQGPPVVVVPPTSGEILADAKSHTQAELKTAARSLANTQYTGSKQTAELNITLAQTSMKWLFDTDITNPPTFLYLPYHQLVDDNGAIDTSVSCGYGGTAKVIGQLNEALQGNISLVLNNCSENYENENINGNAALTINSNADYTSDIVIYYDNVSYSYIGDSVSVSGYLGLIETFGQVNGDYTFTQDFHTAIKINNESLLFKYQTSFTSELNAQDFTLSGDLYLFDAGKISLSTEDLDSDPPYSDKGSLTLTADKTTAFEFGSSQFYVRYLEDIDSDGVFDVGTFFTDGFEVLTTDVSLKSLVDIANMSIPPVVTSPRYYSNEDTTTNTLITVENGYFEDADNTLEELTISFVWLLNGDVIPNQSSSTLPTNIAVFGDELSVAMIVSDGVNVIQGSALIIRLEDAPSEVVISDVPDIVRAGDTVMFSAIVSDPDELPSGSNSSASAMIGAPAGATIDDNGQVSWQAPSDMLFPTQTFSFTFITTSEPSTADNTVIVDVVVHSEQAMPIARNGMESPKTNHSVVIGDFNGDGLNEILSTDSKSSVFLHVHEQDTYMQMWAYPFTAGTGDVVQVLAANLDSDDDLEIVVVSKNSINVIYDLSSMAVEFLATNDNIKFAQIADTNQDGILDIAYLSEQTDFSSDDTLLTVRSLNETGDVLFTTAVDDALEIAFGNVDNDSNLELVTNNGLVYDASTWQNEWLSSNAFGDTTIALGDFNNDGVDEVAGASEWGTFAVYSVVARAQLAALDNVNSCSLTTANVDGDSAVEMILGNCQWGNIAAYKLVNNQLEQVWSNDIEEFRSVSLVSGDSDNDGQPELHWGSGRSSSSANVFAGADLNIALGTASLKAASASATQLNSYHSAGWSNISDNNENAIFFIPQTQNGSQGSRIVYMQADGSASLSDQVSNNWAGNSKAVANDFNNDGFGDIFLPLNDTFDSAFGAMQLSNESIHWQTSSNNSSTSDIGIIRSHDINNDGFDDALYVEGGSLKIIDVYNQTIIANISLARTINDLAVLMVDGELTLAVANNNKVTLFTYNGTLMSQQSFIEQQCDRLLAINYDLDDAKELLCMTDDGFSFSNSGQSLVVFELQDKVLVEAQRSALNINVSALVVDPSTSSQQGLFLAGYLYSNDDFSYRERHDSIIRTTTKGDIIWRSPEMVGQASQGSLKARLTANQQLELLFSTDQMMYWIK